VLIVNGTADPINPFRGGDVIGPTGVLLGRVLSSTGGARYLEHTVGGPGEVRLVALEGGGHVVPGPASRFPKAAGRNTPTFNGVREALEFFDRARRRNSARERGPTPDRTTGSAPESSEIREPA
jgi:polyhydroxybutyrate depolymerase